MLTTSDVVNGLIHLDDATAIRCMSISKVLVKCYHNSWTPGPENQYFYTRSAVTVRRVVVLPYTRIHPHLAQISGRCFKLYITAGLPPAYRVSRRHVSDDGVAPP